MLLKIEKIFQEFIIRKLLYVKGSSRKETRFIVPVVLVPNPFHLRNSVVRTTCRRLRISVCLTASNSLVSDTRTFLARFQDR